jgi:hypothetical protein
MKQIKIAIWLVVLLTASQTGTTWAAGKHAMIKGYVIDSSCTYMKDLKKPISPECAVACAKAGSPLVIQAENGTIYLPIAGTQPAGGQNDRLMPFAGKLVTVSGTVYEKGGSHAIIIEKIEGASKP